MKAIADCKAALAVQRPFIKPVSEMSYPYTPQTHFCIWTRKLKIKTKNTTKESPKQLYVCLWGRPKTGQCLDKQNASGFRLTQAKELPVQALELEDGMREPKFWKISLPFPSVSATYLCIAQKNKRIRPPKLYSGKKLNWKNKSLLYKQTLFLGSKKCHSPTERVGYLGHPYARTSTEGKKKNKPK